MGHKSSMCKILSSSPSAAQKREGGKKREREVRREGGREGKAVCRVGTSEIPVGPSDL